MSLLDYANAKMAEEKMRSERENMRSERENMASQAQCGIRRPSLREEAESQVGYHRTQADKQDRAAAFFREHPEFDEFIQLVRSGVIAV